MREEKKRAKDEQKVLRERSALDTWSKKGNPESAKKHVYAACSPRKVAK